MERPISSDKSGSNDNRFKRKSSNTNIKPPLINLNVENNHKNKIISMINKDNLSDKISDKLSSHSSKSANR